MSDLSWITPETVLAARRELSRRSLADFVRLAWPVIEPGQPYVHGPHVDVMCQALERVARGETKRLLLNVPPGTMKSLLVGVFFPMWMWGPQNRPSYRIVGVAHEQSLGVRDNLKCRRLAASDWYQSLWGDRVQLTGDQNTKVNFENTATGFRQVATPSNITGRRGDCLLAGSMVQTDQGLVAIEDIVNSSYSGKVLSYEADTARMAYRSVQAVARCEASDFYRVHTASGSVVECTGDHRIYTARGYVEARLLAINDVLLRSVREADPQTGLRDQEGREARDNELLLQPIMRTDTHEPVPRENGSVLQCVQGEDTKGCEAMRAEVCGSSVESPCGVEGDRAPDVSVRVLQQDVRGKVDAKAPVLFCELQGARSFIGHGRASQSWLAERGQSSASKSKSGEAVQVCKATDNRTGRIGLRGVSLVGSAGGTSHRHERGEQCVVQSGDVVQSMPSLVPCGRAIKTESDTVSLVERVCEPAVVYDIQVEGTRCFFANGILVHNCVILDDPLSAENANSEAEREKVNLWFREALPTRLNNPDSSAIIVVMQRLHERDVSGLILSEQLGYDHLMLPMRFEPDRADPYDWRTEDGELLFPARFSDETVSDLEKTLGPYATAGQLQQRPAPREGGLFKPSWFQIIDALPAGRPVRTVRAWDLAATKKAATNNPDWTAGLKASKYADGSFVIMGVKRLRGSPMDVEQTVLQTAATDGTGVTIRMTQDPGQAGKAQAEQFIRKLSGYPVVSKPATGDKATRATPAAAQAEVGNIKIYRTGDADQDAWIAPFLDEVSLFPAGAHDDQVDVLADAINELALGYTVNYAAW